MSTSIDLGAGRVEHAHLRLTARGRVVVALFAVALIATISLVFGSAVAATDQVEPSGVIVTVQPGQTLWQIAATHRPEADVRQTVSEITRLNSLPSDGKLAIGTELMLPAAK